MNGVMGVVGRLPIYRYILRAHPEATELLAGGGPALFACVHQDVFDCFNGLPRVMQERPLAAMVSYSRDGGLAASGLAMLGYEVVRGSSSKGGGEGLMLLRANLASGTSVVMVCDGPKAPLGDVKPGVARLAASAGVPILPIRAWGKNQLRFHRNWSKAALTMPGCPVVICVGAPIRVPEATRETRPFQLAVARSISDLACWASVWAGGPPLPPTRRG
ncbi:MAG: DUF374 domain-containing protein, partial [Planctomycetes bacterium]|nr:DUF374 domain-containing protein [Planctomycetota bacterium]